MVRILGLGVKKLNERTRKKLKYFNFCNCTRSSFLQRTNENTEICKYCAISWNCREKFIFKMASQKNHGSNDFDPVERFNKRTKCNNQQQFFLPQMQHNISQQKSFTSPPSTPQLRSLHFNPTQTAPSPNPNVNVNDDDDDEEG